MTAINLSQFADQFQPQLPALVSAIDPRLASSALSNPDANLASGQRVIVPRTGVLRDIAVYVSTQFGNLDVGVYSTGATRAKLWSSGAQACPAAGWRILGDPQISVVAGDHLDFVIAVDNTTALFAARSMPVTDMGQLPSGFVAAPDGAAPKLYWFKYVYPLPASFTEATISPYSYSPLLIARVA